MTSNEYFDDLRLGVLEQFAQQWVHDFKDIQIIRIELRRFMTPRRLAGHKDQATTLYAIVFWTIEERGVAAEAKKLLRAIEIETGEIGMLPYFSSDKWRHMFLRDTAFNLEQKFHELQVRGVAPIAPFEQLVSATKYMQTVPPSRYPELFGNDFKKIYHRGAFPGEDYLKEWTFIPIAKGENLPLAVQNNTLPVLLYPSSHKKPDTVSVKAPLVPKNQQPIDKNTLVLKHGAAADRLYTAMVKRIKAQGKTLTHATPKIRRDEALGVFNANPDYFFPINRRQIDPLGPYEDSEKIYRKMIGTIIMLAHIPDTPTSYQLLYDLFKTLKKNSIVPK